MNNKDKLKLIVSGALLVICILLIGWVTKPFFVEQSWSLAKVFCTAITSIFALIHWNKEPSISSAGKFLFFVGVACNSLRYFIITQFYGYPIDYWGDLTYHLLVIILCGAQVYAYIKEK